MDGLALADPMNDGRTAGPLELEHALVPARRGRPSERIGRAPATATCPRTPYTSSRPALAVCLPTLGPSSHTRLPQPCHRARAHAAVRAGI